jgi:hypothetical protein
MAPLCIPARLRTASLHLVALAALAAVALFGCGRQLTGNELPSEISAVSVRNGASLGADLFAELMEAYPASALPESSDYKSEQVRKYVDVQVLNHFQILASVFDAIRQTHHTENLGAGWYKSMVTFQDPGDHGNATRLQEWYTRSQAVMANGSLATLLQAKILAPDGDSGELELVRAESHVWRAPELNEDGSLANLGVWELRAAFGDEPGVPSEYFQATGDVLESGESRITVEDHFVEDVQGFQAELGTRAILVRSAHAGYGLAEFPDWDACEGPDGQFQCQQGPPLASVRFAYDDSHLVVELEGGEMLAFDRGSAHEVVQRYRIYSEDGSRVEKTRRFGFPVRSGAGHFGWYGAWEDRHELWLDGEPAADGLVVQRDGLPGDEPAPSYTVERFDGALTRVSLIEGSVEQLRGVPSEMHYWTDFQLVWNAAAGRWDRCMGDDGFGGCQSLEDFSQRLSTLSRGSEADPREVWINGCRAQGEEWICSDYVYLEQDPGPGFFEAAPDPETGWPASTGVPLDTGALEDGFALWVGMGGRSYVEYTGDFDGPVTTTGWVEKEVVDFDQEAWRPVFGDADREFVFEPGREVFVYKRGTSLRVTRVAETGSAEDYAVFMEKHRVVKPEADLGEVYPPGTLLEEPWSEDGSKFALDVDPESPNYLLLEFAVVSDADAQDGIQVGDLVGDDLWGLRVAGDDTPMEEAVLFNWEIQAEGEDFGGVSYLVDEQGDYVLLDDPLQFEPVALPTTRDLLDESPQEEWLSYSLAYDGWLQGLPDTDHELRTGELSGDAMVSVLEGNVRVPDGLPLFEEGSGDVYFAKAVDVSMVLEPVSDPESVELPDLAPAEALDLDAELPDYTVPDLDTTIPEEAPLRYVEGLPVE